MICRCEIETCSIPDETRKVCEDFEAVTHSVCWECGDKIKETVGAENMKAFLFVIEAIEKELK